MRFSTTSLGLLHFLTIILIISCFNVAVIDTQNTGCPDSIGTCTCKSSIVNSTDSTTLITLLSITCDEVPMEEVKVTFSRISPPIDIDDLKLYIRQSSGETIPADLLGQNRVTRSLMINGPVDTKPLIRVDPNAFRSSINSLQSVSIIELDSRLLDFGFLEGFQNVSELNIRAVTDLYRSLPTLPDLPSLTKLTFFQEPSLNTAFGSAGVNFFLNCNGLISLTVYNCAMDDIGMDQLLEWIMPSSSKTLKSFDTSSNLMRKIPIRLNSFEKLQYVNIYDSAPETTSTMMIPSNTFNFDGELVNGMEPSISLRSNKIDTVESNAFQGDYTFTKVYLSSNLLTRFEESAFKSMLQDMYDGLGFLYVSDNRFDCYTDSCHLAWLLRDNRDLLDSLEEARCYEDFKPFENLTSTLFDNCPII